MPDQAIAALDGLGAVSKPFAVKSIALAGWVVRFDDDQRGAEGLISARAKQALREFSQSTPLLLELRSASLEERDCRAVLELQKLAGLDVAGAEGASPLIEGISQLTELRILDLSLARRDARSLAGAAKLRNLARLCLSQTELDDAAIDVLGACSALKELFIDHHRASKESIARLRSKLTGCRIVT